MHVRFLFAMNKKCVSVLLLCIMLLQSIMLIFAPLNVYASGSGLNYISLSYSTVSAQAEIFQQFIYVQSFNPDVNDSSLIICRYLSESIPMFEVAIKRTSAGSDQLRLFLFNRDADEFLCNLELNKWYNITFKFYYSGDVASVIAWVNSTQIFDNNYGYYYPDLDQSQFGGITYVNLNPSKTTYKIYFDNLYQYAISDGITVINENFEGEFPGSWSVEGNVGLSTDKYYSPTHSLEVPQIPATVTVTPTSAHLVYNATATFTVSVEGISPPYSYQWYLDGVAVGGNTSTFNYTAPFQDGVHHLYCNITKGSTQYKSNVAIITVSRYSFPQVIPLAYYPEFLIAGTSTSTSTSAIVLSGESISFESTSHNYKRYGFSFYQGGTEQIVNGGFETGELSPWVSDYATITSSVTHSGVYALNMTPGKEISQQITPVYVDAISKLGFWFKRDDAETSTMTVYLYVNYTDIGFRAYSYDVDTSEWTYLDYLPFLRKDEGAIINCIKIYATPGFAKNYYVDDVTLVGSTTYSEERLVNAVHFSCNLTINQFGDPIYNNYVTLCGLTQQSPYDYTAGLGIQNATYRFGLFYMWSDIEWSDKTAQLGRTYKIDIYAYIHDRIELWIDNELVLTKQLRVSLNLVDECMVGFSANTGATHIVSFNNIQVEVEYISISSPPLYMYNGRDFGDLSANSKFAKVNQVSSAAWGNNQWVITATSIYDWGECPETTIKGRFPSGFSTLEIAPNTYLSITAVDFDEDESYFLIGGTNYTDTSGGWELSPILVKYDGATTQISTPFSSVSRTLYETTRTQIITEIENCENFWLISGKVGETLEETLYKWNGTWSAISNFGAGADVTCIKWNGQYALISVGNTVYAYVNDEISLISTFPGTVYTLCWNNQYWLIGGVGFLAKFDGNSITFLNSQANIASTDIIYSIAWNTHEWLIGGKSSSPLLLKYDGDAFYDLSSDLLASGYPSNSYITFIDDAFIYGIYYPIIVHPKEVVTPEQLQKAYCLPLLLYILLTVIFIMGVILYIRRETWKISIPLIPVIFWLILFEPKVPLEQMPISILRYFTVPPWHLIWAITLTIIAAIAILSKKE